MNSSALGRSDLRVISYLAFNQLDRTKMNGRQTGSQRLLPEAMVTTPDKEWVVEHMPAIPYCGALYASQPLQVALGKLLERTIATAALKGCNRRRGATPIASAAGIISIGSRGVKRHGNERTTR